MFIINSVFSEFDPYIDHGGTVLGLAGHNYVIMASDKRLSEQYMIRSRNVSRIMQIDDDLFFSGSGCWSDILELSKVLKIEALQYEWSHKSKMSVKALSYLLAAQLYTRRLFPYYSFSLVGGMDADGHGAIYHYDALGSFERVMASCAGKGEHLIQPILDELTNMEADDELWTIAGAGENVFVSTQSSNFLNISIHVAIDTIVRAYRAAAEREISIGDELEIHILEDTTNNGNNSDSVGHDNDNDDDNNNSNKQSKVIIDDGVGTINKNHHVTVNNCNDNDNYNVNHNDNDREGWISNHMKFNKHKIDEIMQKKKYQLHKLYFSLPKH